MVATVNSINKRLTAAANRTINAGYALDVALHKMQKPVAELYKTGAVRLAPAAAPTKADAPRDAALPDEDSSPIDAADVDQVLSGSVNELLAGSACTSRAFRDAVIVGDDAFMKRIEGKLLIWRVMLVEAATPADGRSLAGVMAEGGSYAAEFPLDSDAEILMPGVSLVIAGEARRSDDGWTFRVLAWGVKRDLDAGQPMTRCEWPKAVE